MSKFEDFHAVLHSMLEQEKQFLYQHIESSRQRRRQGGDDLVVPLINLLISYTLEQKEGPDEEKLIQRLQAENRFHSYNNTLFHAYKKVLKLIHEADSKDPSSRLQHLLFIAGWFRRHSILDQLPEILNEAEKIAREQEHFHDEIKVLQHRKFLFSIIPGKLNPEMLSQRVTQLCLQSTQAIEIELLADELQLKKILMASGHGETEDLSHSPLLTDIDACQSVRARIHFLRAWINIYISRKDYPSALSSISDLIALLGATEQFLSDPSMSAYYYQYAFSGAQASIALKKPAEEERFMAILEDGVLKSADPAKYFEYSTRIWLWKTELNAVNSKAEFEKLTQIQKNLDKYRSHLGEGADIIISHQAAVLLMASGMPGKAIAWIRRYQLAKPGFHRPDLVCYSYVFFVIAKFELEEWDMVARGKRSALNFLQKNNFSNPFFDLLLKGLLKCSNLSHAREQAASLTSLKSELTALLKTPGQQLYNSFFDHLSWLDKMILKRK